MSKEKIIDIKSVKNFYKALRDEVANTFNSYERGGIFDGWTEQQKKECFGFGTHILSIVYNPIQKRYTKQERKKYEKIVNKYEDICKRQDQQITDLQKQLAEKEQEIESLRENSLSKRIFKEKLIPSHCMEQYEKYEQQIDKLMQDKISFAVEQIVKTKETLIKFLQDEGFYENEWYDLFDKIDNQINELKGEK